MMRLSHIEAFKKISSKNFGLRDIKFEEFLDVGETELKHTLCVQRDGFFSEFENEFSQLDIWAHMSFEYSGEPPESYRVLNSMIMDSVDEFEPSIKKELNPKLKEFVKEKFPGIDAEDLDEDVDDYIWEDQVDYYPSIDPDEKRIHFMVELVLEIEDFENEEE